MYIRNLSVPSLQAFYSHGRRYYCIVESFRKDGKPRVRVLAHLGRVEDLLRRLQNQCTEIRVCSVTAGAVTALLELANELTISDKINAALKDSYHRVQKRDGLTVGETLLAGIIGRACAPRSKRAFADWAQDTSLPELMGLAPQELTSQHFWDQMHAVRLNLLGEMEQAIVQEVLRKEQLQPEAVAYDTTNFYTHIASTNAKPKLPQHGHNKQGRHDLRQLGLALVVDQATQFPLAHTLHEGARSDMRTFAAFPEAGAGTVASLTATGAATDLGFRCGRFFERRSRAHRAGFGPLCNRRASIRPSRPVDRGRRTVARNQFVDASGRASLAHTPSPRRPRAGHGSGFQSATL
jgi:hypothetical protein